MFGEGGTHGSPVSSHGVSRPHAPSGETTRSRSSPRSDARRRASSPDVRPCRTGIEWSPTKERKPGSWGAPSTPPAERVRPVAGDEALAELGARLHREQHRPVVGVVAAADVRNVEDDGVYVREVLGLRLQARPGRAVERDDGKPGLAVDRGRDVFHVDRAAVDSMLRSEEARQARPGQSEERLPGRDPAGCHPGRVRDETDAPSFHRGRVGQKGVDPEDRARRDEGQESSVPESGRGWSGFSPRASWTACGRSSATARRQSPAPFGEPGSARTRARPRTPATWRDR